MAYFAGRYERLNQLGAGGFGVVWRAHDHNLGRDLALKLFSPGSAIDVATYEAKTLIALEGPRILPVRNADKYMDVPYIATEIAEAGTAADTLGPFGVSPQRAIRWIRDLLIGLGTTHRHRLLHRDIKLSNLFLQNDDQALLGDFGIAAAMDTNGRAPAHGSFSIRAPEAYSTGSVTVRSDIYSTAHAFYHLVTGVDPFLRATTGDTIAAVQAQSHPRVRELAPHVPRTLAMRIEKAMATDPSNRYSSASEFHAAFGGLPQFQIEWVRISPHAGHDRCWRGLRLNGGYDLDVCVEKHGSDYTYETRRAGGAGLRVVSCCGSAGSESELNIRLRRVFEVL